MLRFASSPTHDMDINTLCIAIVNYLVAQQNNDGFMIRIDDMDKVNNIEGKDTETMQILEKFALGHNAVFHQSEHLHMHQTLAIKLLEEAKAFICTCQHNNIPCTGDCEKVDTSAYTTLKESGTPFVIRLKKPTESILFHDLIRGDIITTPDDIDDFVILDTNGTPSELFASACDDMLSDITTIIERENNIQNTTKTVHIKSQLGYTQKTNYAHLPIIRNAPTIKSVFEEGFIPDALINYLIFLIHPNVPQEIFTLPDAIKWFKIENIVQSPIIFDREQLYTINRAHLKKIDDKVLSTVFGFADADIGKLAKLYLKEVATLSELKVKIETIFSPKNFQTQWENQMRTLETLIQDAPMYQEFSDFKSYLLKESGLSGKAFFIPLRLLLTGDETGPELSDIYPLIKSYILEIAS
jgi:glutamyl-tRNA synthetase